MNEAANPDTINQHLADQSIAESVVIRPAVMPDIVSILAMSESMYLESPMLRNLTWNRTRMNGIVSALLQSPDTISIVAEAEYPHGIIGMFGGAITRHIFSDDPVAMDYALYVYPQWRKYGVGTRLLDVYVEWARSKGVKLIQAGIASSINTESAMSAYLNAGFTETGKYMVWQNADV